ncbi:hypothetical protein [Legionella londiniensis]|uniref:Histone-lysine N-methyltransferase, H3 lysine-79 specific n=1 Tax=Legionella londiniensis TaxID=45068 RepID=A0A0W0VJA5_9GAMM|nr:hypothetical protein [Legionella londiniensis]KTD20193.1 histone methylation protein DOT1 [Legionella londiniensis]STX94360.1 putative methyltransferases [Legionella londiniensis]
MIEIIASAAIIIIIFGLVQFFKQAKIKRWRGMLHLDQHQLAYEGLYRDVDGFALSKSTRQLNDAIEYLYGEIDFVSFIALLSLAKPNSETVFYDLGSGTGKAVIACAMVFKVKKSFGIELFATLHQAALMQKERLRKKPAYSSIADRIHFIHDNFLQADFTGANMIFINASAFIGETWKALSQKLAKTQPGTIIIITSKMLPAPQFRLTRKTYVKMSWGIVSAYIYQRRLLV